MPSPGPGGSQSSLAEMVVSWLTSQFRTGPKQQPKKGAPIASYTMGTDPTALGGNARGDFRGKITHHVWPDSGARLQRVSVGQIRTRGCSACSRHIMRFPSCRPRRRHPGGAS